MRWAISKVLEDEQYKAVWQCEEIDLSIPDAQALKTPGYGSLSLAAGTGKVIVGWQNGNA